MGQSAPRRRPRREQPPEADDLGEFLQQVSEVEAEDPDEPERWAEFFGRLRATDSVSSTAAP